jgi:hypothetical protein
MKNSWLAVVLVAALGSQAQSLRAVSVNIPEKAGFPAAISFFCSQSYERDACRKDVLAVRVLLAAYPVDRLGQWTFLLVPSDQWKPLVGSLGGDAASPAFTVLERRTTVLEQALFSGSPVRELELLKRFGAMRDGLMQLAISHELGHAICSEANEARADEYGHELREKKSTTCGR